MGKVQLKGNNPEKFKTKDIIRTLIKISAKMGKVQLKGNDPESKIMIKTLFKMFTKIKKVQPKRINPKTLSSKKSKTL